MKGYKKTFHASVNKKKAGVAVLISDKINFKPKMVIRNKESHDIIIGQFIKKI